MRVNDTINPIKERIAADKNVVKYSYMLRQRIIEIWIHRRRDNLANTLFSLTLPGKFKKQIECLDCCISKF